MIGDIENNLENLWEIDFYRNKANRILYRYKQLLKWSNKRKRLDMKVLKKNRRFVLTRVYLNKSRLWYFGKKNFLTTSNTQNPSIITTPSFKPTFTSIINGLTKTL